MMDKLNVLYTTVKNKYCIGCGICSAVCPTRAIEMRYKVGKFVPDLNKEKCIGCGKCADICPNSDSLLLKMAKSARINDEAVLRGVKGGRGFLFQSEDSNICKSASGGFVTWAARILLETGKISAVIHAHPIITTFGKPHFEVCVSRSVDEIERGRSSFYAPLDYSKVLDGFKGKKENILIIGVPCVIRGVKLAFAKDKSLSENRIYTIALACSHNVTGEFADTLAREIGVKDGQKFGINFRKKSVAENDANNFHISIYDSCQELYSKNRYIGCNFTTYWRNYKFAQPVCNYCSDFFGMDADVSAKDAWGPYANSPVGANILVIRSKTFLDLVPSYPKLFKYISLNDIVNYEYEPIVYKQRFAYSRMTKKFSIGNYFLNGDLHVKNAEKNVRGKFYLNRKGRLFSLFKKIYMKLNKKCVGNSVRPILIMGGYGYGNVGDEAQLEYCYTKLKDILPGCRLKVLTPDPEYTIDAHPNMEVDEAPRLGFFDMDCSSIYAISHLKATSLKGKIKAVIRKLYFIYLSRLLIFNARLLSRKLHPLFINSRKISLLNEFKNCTAVFYTGGGYLTGETLSRLWDAFCVIKVAKVFKKKVFISGQTVGLWNSKYTERKAKKIFSECELISCRDHADSVDALNKLGLPQRKIMPVCDDALFIDADYDLSSDLRAMNNLEQKEYVALNIQVWGMNSEKKKSEYTQKIIKIVEKIQRLTGLPVVLFSNTPGDEEAINLFISDSPDRKNVFVYPFIYNFNRIIALIRDAKYCVTMKHHPIIFAMGKCVPTIALIYDPYYKHKNQGALALFNQENCVVDLDSTDYLECFSNILTEITRNYDKTVSTINHNLTKLKMKQDDFYKKVKEGILS